MPSSITAWIVVGASVCGSGHAVSGIPCQDAHRYLAVGHGILIVAVADGAGSAAQSEIGARTACDTAVDWLDSALCHRSTPVNETEYACLLREALGVARVAVLEKSASLGFSPRELSTTLLLAIVSNSSIVAAQVGDGAIVFGDDSGELRTLAVPQRGEYLNETTFIVAPDAVENASVASWSGAVQSLAVITDGLQLLALDLATGNPHPPFFGPMLRHLARDVDHGQLEAEVVDFLRSPRVAEKADDDLTIVLAARRHGLVSSR